MRRRQLVLAVLGAVAAAGLAVVVRSAATEKTPTGPPAAATAEKSKPDAKRPAATYRSVLIRDVPHVQQKPGFCGEACAAMYLQKLGQPVDIFTAADYAQHLMKLKKKVPPKGFTIVIQAPFVVIGDESPTMVKQRAEGTVKWAVDKLKQAYFSKDPARILDIWLFKDAASYDKHCKGIFNHTPTTPYGYFSHTEGALIMDIHTGGGTLVHEIVHPFMAANFPECPAWLNEGLGSLYEQSDERNGQIVGRTNWRLVGGWGPFKEGEEGGLKQAIREKRVPSFKTLCSTTDDDFYEKDNGTNYAQARYLCYYLQEHGLLRKFYHAFLANRKQDPTGYETLKAVLGRQDMDKFQKDWEAYVLKLRFPERP